MKELVVSGKALGGVAGADFCARCFWIAHHLRPMPFQVFPAIFGDIDRFTKAAVHQAFDETGRQPPYLDALGDHDGYLVPPHWSRFRADHPSGLAIRGEADGILTRGNERTIVDYKTARYTEGQDSLLPIYEVQLNAYAWIAEQLGMGPVTQLALVYFEPQVGARDAASAGYDRGLTMDFVPRIHNVAIQTARLDACAQQAYAVLGNAIPPIGRKCKDCLAIERLRRGQPDPIRRGIPGV